MIKYLLYGTIFFLFLQFTYSTKQDDKYPFDKWDAKTLKKAEAYSEEDEIPALEKEIIYLCNLARLNPKLFAQTYLAKYMDENEIKNTWTASLIRDLNKCPKLDVIKFDAELTICAKLHAESNGKKGLEGHQNYNQRFKKYGSQFGHHGENCDYGNNVALDVVMSLMIDEDVPGAGHRANILDKNFKAVGVAYAPHKTQEHNVVMCFGG